MNKTLLAVSGAAIAIVVVFVGHRAVRSKAAANTWSIPAREIAEEEIKQDGDVMRSRFVTFFEKPLWRVEALVWDLENLQHTVPEFKVSRLLRADVDKVKRMEIGMQGHDLPLLMYEMEFVIDRDAHRVTFKTLRSDLQDIDGEYELDPSPDGSKTRLVYTTVARAKVPLPISPALAETMARETFIHMVQAIKKSFGPE